MSKKLSAGLIFSTAVACGGAGLTAILTKGQSTWVPQNHWLVPSLFSFAIALLIWSLFLWRAAPVARSDGSPLALQDVKSSQTLGASSPAFAAGRDIHVSYAPPAHVPTTYSETTTSKPDLVAKSPNLEYVGSRERRVFISPDARQGICDPQTSEERDKSLQALVLKLENKILPGRNITRARNVIAKIRFQSEDGVTQRLIDYGVWLNSASNTDDFGIGDTRELVLLCAMDGSLLTFEDKRVDGDRYMPGFGWFEDSNVDGLGMVEVTVIDRETQHVLNVKLKVWLDGNRFCVAVR